MKKLVKESLNESNVRDNIETTVDELFTWYSGGDDWDEEITDSMTVDNEYPDTEELTKYLKKHKNTPITVESVADTQGTWDLIFMLNGKEFCMQALSAALTDIEEDEWY